jgi:hypothetical protein
MERPGTPTQENGKVKDVRRCVVANILVLSAIRGAGTGVVGVNMTSTVCKQRSTRLFQT